MKLKLIKFSTILGMLAIVLYIIYFAWVNYAEISLATIKIPIFTSEPITTTVAAIILFTAVIGGCAGFLYTIKINAQCDDAIKYYKEKYNKATMGKDENSALVENLQRKISSLEIALEQALRKNN